MTPASDIRIRPKTESHFTFVVRALSFAHATRLLGVLSTVRSDLGNGTCWPAAAAVSYTFRWGLVYCCRGRCRRYSCCWSSGSCSSPTGIGKICCWTSLRCCSLLLLFLDDISGCQSTWLFELEGLRSSSRWCLRKTTLSSNQLGPRLPFRCRFLITI